MEEQREPELSYDFLANRGLSMDWRNLFIKHFGWVAPVSEVLTKLQKIVNTVPKPKHIDIYFDFAAWVAECAPQNNKPLILDKLPKGYFFQNGDVHVKKGVQGGCHAIIGGRLKVTGNINLSSKDCIIANDINTQVINIYGRAYIGGGGVLDVNVANVYNQASINDYEILNIGKVNVYNEGAVFIGGVLNTQKVNTKDKGGIYGKVNLINPSTSK